ncbi:hypothetical protein ZPAH1_orf00176 [Aeromonas phage ZPAH1]|nr:hypothetical protein ZPAH1_orf00176 [Aeromonas phage ZPAH1]
MEKITKFGVYGSFLGKESSLLESEEYINMVRVVEHIKQHGYCYIYVTSGDYTGSVAKFIPADGEFDNHKTLYWRTYSRETSYNSKYYVNGRLKWVGKKNNPKFTLMSKSCYVIIPDEGEKIEEVLVRYDPKKERESMELSAKDIDGRSIEIGDLVLYINTRYGSGSELCHGRVKAFKGYPRDGVVSIIISNETRDEESECRQPSFQIYKK